MGQALVIEDAHVGRPEKEGSQQGGEAEACVGHGGQAGGAASHLRLVTLATGRLSTAEATATKNGEGGLRRSGASVS